MASMFSEEQPYCGFNEATQNAEATKGVVAGGISAAYAREALSLLQDRAAKVGETVPP